MNFQNKFFSYGALNTLSLSAYSIFLNRMIQLKNIYDVNLFLFLSPLLLAATFYCLQRWINKNEYKRLKEYGFYFSSILLWIILLKSLEFLYNYVTAFRFYLSLFNSELYLYGFIAAILIFYLSAKNKINPFINITASYLIYGILFLKTLNAIKWNNGIEVYYFVNPYIYLMIANITIWIIVWMFFDLLKRHESGSSSPPIKE